MKNHWLLKIMEIGLVWIGIPSFLILLPKLLEKGYPFYEETLDFLLNWRKEKNRMETERIKLNSLPMKRKKLPPKK